MIQDMNALAKQNMLLNQKASQDQSGFDVAKLRARLQEEKMQKGSQSNADFNKKRKEHYRNEFHIAKNSALTQSNNTAAGSGGVSGAFASNKNSTHQKLEENKHDS